MVGFAGDAVEFIGGSLAGQVIARFFGPLFQRRLHGLPNGRIIWFMWFSCWSARTANHVAAFVTL